MKHTEFVKRLKTHHKILYALIVGTGVVAFWRGAWEVMDVLLLPQNYLLSSIVSLCFGILILASLHVIVSQFVYD